MNKQSPDNKDKYKNIKANGSFKKEDLKDLSLKDIKENIKDAIKPSKNKKKGKKQNIQDIKDEKANFSHSNTYEQESLDKNAQMFENLNSINNDDGDEEENENNQNNNNKKEAIKKSETAVAIHLKTNNNNNNNNSNYNDTQNGFSNLNHIKENGHNNDTKLLKVNDTIINNFNKKEQIINTEQKAINKDIEDNNLENIQKNKHANTFELDESYFKEHEIKKIRLYKRLKEHHHDINFNSIRTKNVVGLVMNAALGFFFMGYNLGSFNVMIVALSVIFEWSEESEMTLIAVGSAIIPIGALVGGILGGFLASKLGRRRAIQIIDIVGIIGGLICVIENTGSFIAGKFVMGVSVGGFSSVVEVYIEEFVPTSQAGFYGMFNFMFFSTGVLIAHLLGLPLGHTKEEIDRESNYWRFMVILPCITNLINLLIFQLCYNKDTPYYNYIHVHDENKAIRAYKYIYKDEKEIGINMRTLKNIKKELENKGLRDGITYKELFSRKYLVQLVVGVVINFTQQASAINVFTFYSNIIYVENEPEIHATKYTIMLSAAELIGNTIALFLIERLGRKKFFIIGFSGAVTCLTVEVILYYIGEAAFMHKFIVIVFYLFVGFSTDPIVWILTADILPEIGVGICSSINWITAIAVVISFPYLYPKTSIGLANTFIIYAICTLCGLIFGIFVIKEPKGKSVVQLQKAYQKWF